MTKLLFWFSVGTIFYTYAGYPLVITVLARWKRKIASSSRNFGTPRNNGGCPTVSVIISVYNEEDTIRRKLENCLRLDYPKDKLEILVGSDGSTDGTNGILEKYRDQACILTSGERKGKPETINRLVKEAKGEILFFTDARQLIRKDALKKLVRNFADQAVGCVSGELVFIKRESITGRGIGAYWKYEKHIRRMESDVYSTIGATGAIYAVRKALFEPIPNYIILDDVWVPLRIVYKGYKSIFEREAIAYDMFAEIPHDEHRRKVRTLSGNYQIFSAMPYMLNPLRSRLALQIISHKFLRLVAPFCMVTLFISNLFLAKAPLYAAFLAAQVLFYALAALEAAFRRQIKRIFGIPYLFCLLNFSALVGLWNFLFGRTEIKWEKAH